MTSNKIWNVDECVTAYINLNILAKTKEEAIQKFKMLGAEEAKKYVEIDWNDIYYIDDEEFDIEEYKGDHYDIE